jgi:recombinase
LGPQNDLNDALPVNKLDTHAGVEKHSVRSPAYRQGGTPGYGLRRQLLDQHGQPKAILARGERKSFQLERVILTPGPEMELTTVRRIYDLFTVDHCPEAQIAALLSNEGILAEAGRIWTRGTVYELLTNEKYIGNNPIQLHQYQAPTLPRRE